MVIRDKFGRFIKGNQSRLGKAHTIATKEKISDKLKGRKLSEKTKEKMGLAKQGNTYSKGRIPWNREKSNVFSKEAIEKMSNAKKGDKNPNFGKKLSKEQVKKILRRRPKSSLELKFEQLITKLNLPYKFVGNGEVIIGRKCPDFINTNGEKIAIEVFYRRHKEMFRNGLENWKQERQKIFNKYGWKLEFFNEIQVNEKEINKRIGVEKI